MRTYNRARQCDLRVETRGHKAHCHCGECIRKRRKRRGRALKLKEPLVREMGRFWWE